MTEPFSLPIVPRYAEIDQQGVVFNGHYLTWFDEASTAFFEHVGVSFGDLASWRLDVQVVHAEVDFVAPIRWRDVVRVGCRCEKAGTTSFTLLFEVHRRDVDETQRVAARGRNVYVVVSTDDWSKREIPSALRDALTSVAGQGRNGTGDGIESGTVSP